MPSRASLVTAVLPLLLAALLGFSAGASTQAPTGTPAASPVAPVPRLPATVTGQDGREITVTDVKRIVPLNGDVAEIVWALGLGPNVVGVDVSATYPPEAERLPKIGYQRQLSAEGILSLEPTVVVGTEEAGPPEVIAQVRGAGVPVVIIADPPTLDAPTAKIRTVAAALGVAEAGARLASQTEREIASARALAAEAGSAPRVIFLYVRGQGTQMVAGSGTSADAMIAAAGGTNAAAEIGIEEFQPLTAEALVAAQPDVLLLLSAGLASIGGVDGLLQIPGVAETPAGRERRVLAYDDLYLLGMGPRSGQALGDLVAGLYLAPGDASPAAAPTA